MKAISRIACCAAVLFWMFNAAAEESVVSQGAIGDDQVTEAPADDSAGSGAQAFGAPSSGVSAADSAADAAQVPTPPAPRIAVVPYQDKVDRASLEKRMQDRAVRNEQRTAQAVKDAAERQANQPVQANPVPGKQ